MGHLSASVFVDASTIVRQVEGGSNANISSLIISSGVDQPQAGELWVHFFGLPGNRVDAIERLIAGLEVLKADTLEVGRRLLREELAAATTT